MDFQCTRTLQKTAHAVAEPRNNGPGWRLHGWTYRAASPQLTSRRTKTRHLLIASGTSASPAMGPAAPQQPSGGNAPPPPTQRPPSPSDGGGGRNPDDQSFKGMSAAASFALAVCAGCSALVSMQMKPLEVQMTALDQRLGEQMTALDQRLGEQLTVISQEVKTLAGEVKTLAGKVDDLRIDVVKLEVKIESQVK